MVELLLDLGVSISRKCENCITKALELKFKKITHIVNFLESFLTLKLKLLCGLDIHLNE